MPEIGHVIKLLMIDFEPPKFKYHIIVGQGLFNNEPCFASVIINSRINSTINSSTLAYTSHYELPHSNYSNFLRHTSYVDCKELYFRTVNEIEKIVTSHPDRILGQISIEDLTSIRKMLEESEFIKGKYIKKFNLRD